MIQVINQKKDLVDISFLPEDVLYLDTLAKEKQVTVVMDCGIAPGMPNCNVGYHNERMNLSKVEYMVGGLPKIRIKPFEYKAPFSPCDVIEEYTRQARYVENGNLIEKEAIRYPGHIKLIGVLKAAGFLDKEPIPISGIEIIPFEFTSRVLFNAWKLGTEEPEFTVMRIILNGIEQWTTKEIIYDLYDEYDTREKISSMARTTGFTATGTAEMILNKVFVEKGVFPPELVGRDPVCFEFIISYLRARNIQFKVTERDI